MSDGGAAPNSDAANTYEWWARGDGGARWCGSEVGEERVENTEKGGCACSVLARLLAAVRLCSSMPRGRVKPRTTRRELTKDFLFDGCGGGRAAAVGFERGLGPLDDGIAQKQFEQPRHVALA
jgi:hypothetical protein